MTIEDILGDYAKMSQFIFHSLFFDAAEALSRLTLLFELRHFKI